MLVLYCNSLNVALAGASCCRYVGVAVENTGHTGSPGPFGLPVAANLVHAPTIWSDRVISAPVQLPRLAAGLVQIHAQIATMPLREHELNVGSVVCQRTEMARRRERFGNCGK